MRVKCPTCATVFEPDDAKAGSAISCPRCGETIRVREKPASSAAPAPPPKQRSMPNPDNSGNPAPSHREPARAEIPPLSRSTANDDFDEPPYVILKNEPWYYRRLVNCAFVVKAAAVIVVVLLAMLHMVELVGLLAGEPYGRPSASARM